MKIRVIFFFTIFLLFSNFSFAQVSAPTIQTCGQQQSFCLEDSIFNLCVKITLEEGSPEYDSFEINWGDGSTPDTIPGSNQTIIGIQHTYDLSDLYYCTGADNYNREFTVALKSFIQGAQPSNNAFIATFINKPRIEYRNNNLYHCVGDPVCLDIATCAISSQDTITWLYESGAAPTTEECYEFDEQGPKTVGVIAANTCGRDTAYFSFQTVDKPIANAVATAGVVNTVNDTAIVCLGDGGLVELNGDTYSISENTYRWTINTSSANYDWVVTPPSQADPLVPRPRILFQNPGVYDLVLEVNNDCESSDRDTIIFRVLDEETLSLNPQEDGCLNLTYQPDPFFNDAQYSVNGMSFTNTTFPIALGVGEYIVEAVLTNDCGTQVLSDTFVVTGVDQAFITLPTQDTSVCVGTDRIRLEALPEGGTWSGSSHISEDQGVYWFDPVEVGNTALTYSRGVGNCQATATINVDVQGVVVEANDYLKCDDSGSFELEATPLGGVWSTIDCASCLSGNTFSISNMITENLDAVELTYTVANNLSCEGVKTITVYKINPNAEFEIVDDTICSAVALELTYEPVPQSSNLWRIDGVEAGTPPFTNLSEGIHTLEMVNIVGECRDSMSRDFRIVDAPSLADFDTNPSDGCADLVVEVVNNSQGQDLTFEWFVDGVSVSTEETPSDFTFGQGLEDTVYTIRLDIRNFCGEETVEKEVTVFPKPIPNFGTLQSNYCSGDTVRFANATAGNPDSYVWDFGDGTTYSGVNPPDKIYFTTDEPTIYPVKLTVANGCGSEELIRDITINPTNVNAFFFTEDYTVCLGEELCVESFSTPGARLEWSFGDGNSSSENSVCHLYNSVGTYEVKLKAFGCGFDSLTANVTVIPLPTVEILTNEQVCPGNELIFEANLVDVVDVEWIFENGETATVQNPSHTFNTSGTHKVKLKGTSANGCEVMDSTLITVIEAPTAAFETVSNQVCSHDPLELNSTATGDNLVSCLWFFGDGGTSNNCTPSHIYEAGNSYTVTHIVANSSGCRDTVSQLIDIVQKPLPIFTYDLDTDCSPATLTVTNESQFSNTYTWDLDNSETSNLENPTTIYNNGGTYNITLTAFNDYCSSSIVKPVEIHQTPQATIALPDTIGCVPFNVEVDGTTTGDALTYFWDFGDGATAYGASTSHEYSGIGYYNIILAVSSPHCQSSTTQLVAAAQDPVPSFTVDANDCTPVIATFTNQTQHSYTYSWDFGNGATSAELNPSAGYEIGGTYDISLTASNEHCSRTFTAPLEVHQSPDIALSPSPQLEMCVPATLSFNVAASGTNLDYTWQFEDGTVAYGNPVDYTFNEAGTQDVKLNVSSSHCHDSLVQTFELFPAVAIDTTLENILCNGAETGNIFLNMTGGTFPFEFEWSNGASTEDLTNISAGNYSLSITDQKGCELTTNFTLTEPAPMNTTMDSSIVSCYGGDDGTMCVEVDGGNSPYALSWSNASQDACISNLIAGDYTLTITDNSGCTQIEQYTMIQNPQLITNLNASDISCYGLNDGSISLDSIYGGASRLYTTTLEGPMSFDGGTFFGQLVPGDYQLMIQDVLGCVYEDNITINEPDQIWVRFVQDTTTIGQGDSLLLSPEHNVSEPMFTWLPETEVNCLDCEDVYIRPYTNTIFSVMVTDENGCKATDSTLVVVTNDRKFYLPNTFTPNDDGRNDIFMVRSRLSSIDKVKAFRIFNRVGEMVFESTDFRPQDEDRSNGWDGTYRGVRLTPDMYTYYIEVEYVDGVTETKKGTITLIR